MLETKQFADRHRIANDLKVTFLQSYFDSNPRILKFAENLIEQGNSAAAKELNKTIAVLGTGVDPQLVIRRDHLKVQSFRKGAARLAGLLEENGYYETADALIENLGGRVNERSSFLGGFAVSIDGLNLHKECENHAQVIEWVRRNLVSRIIART